MKAASRDSSSGYNQTQGPKKKGVCKKGCSKGEKTLFWLQLHIKPKRKQSSHLPNPKRLPLRFSMSFVCTFSVARYFMFASAWFCELKMSGDMSACVCVDIGPALVKPGPQTVFCFSNVLGVSACIASHLVSNREHLACSLISESFCFH